MLESEIQEVLEYQTEYLHEIQEGTPREVTGKVGLKDHHVRILTGIRRCGKSTVLLQIARKYPHFNYLSFEDPRLSTFGVNDVLLNLYNDLIYRDIVVRHSLRNPKVVRELGVYLASNIGKERQLGLFRFGSGF